MRAPLFAKHSNPAVDRPLLRKNIHYVEWEVSAGNADWVDVDDHARGAVLRSLFRHSSDSGREKMIAAGTMTSAWALLQSGYAGPLVWQMPTTRPVLS
jgi:hypothetical protein